LESGSCSVALPVLDLPGIVGKRLIDMFVQCAQRCGGIQNAGAAAGGRAAGERLN